MKLLVCTTEYYPHGSGIANVAYNVVKNLTNMGVECKICSPTGPDIMLGSQALIQKTGIIGMMHFWKQVSQHIDSAGYDAIWLHNPFILKPNSLRNCLITMHSTYLGTSTNGIGNFPYHLYKSIVAKIERFCIMNMPPTTSFVGVSEQVCNEIEEIGIVKKQIAHIPNGVDTKHFRPSARKKELRRKFGIPEKNTVLLSVGRLTPAKRPLTLVEIFSRLEEKFSNMTLCIAGKGELLDEVKNLAEKMELRNIIFLGHVDYDRDLPDLYACSDYYIMTSRYEGLPLTLLEAMASGLPCIVSDIPNLRMVGKINSGLIVNFDNVPVAASSIIKYLESEHIDHALNATHYATNYLDWEIVAKDYLASLRGVADR